MAKLVFSHFNIRCFSRRGSCVLLKRATTECQSEIKGKTTSVTPFTIFHLLLLSCRPAGGESDDAGVLPRRSVVRRNSRSPFPLSNGRQRHGVYYSHHKTHERYNLDQIPHGPAGIPDTLSHLHAHLATSNTPIH